MLQIETEMEKAAVIKVIGVGGGRWQCGEPHGGSRPSRASSLLPLIQIDKL